MLSHAVRPKVHTLNAILLGGLLSAQAALAENTPLNTPIPDNGILAVECEYSLTEPAAAKLIGDAPAKGAYHYRAFVPDGYSGAADKKYPCLFIFSPTGNAPMDNVKGFASEKQWIVIMLDESKNGPVQPSYGNFLAAHDDVTNRFRIAENRKMATGFSGGARVASRAIALRPGFMGVVLQGAGFSQHKNAAYAIEGMDKNRGMAVYGLFGKDDENRREAEKLERQLKGHKCAFEQFPGGHEWAPAEYMRRAIEWVESNNTVATRVQPGTLRPLRPPK